MDKWLKKHIFKYLCYTCVHTYILTYINIYVYSIKPNDLVKTKRNGGLHHWKCASPIIITHYAPIRT